MKVSLAKKLDAFGYEIKKSEGDLQSSHNDNILSINVYENQKEASVRRKNSHTFYIEEDEEHVIINPSIKPDEIGNAEVVVKQPLKVIVSRSKTFVESDTPQEELLSEPMTAMVAIISNPTSNKGSAVNHKVRPITSGPDTETISMANTITKKMVFGAASSAQDYNSGV